MRLGRTVELRDLVIAPANHRAYAAIVVHRQEARFANVTCLALFVENGVHGIVGGALGGDVDRGFDDEVVARSADDAVEVGIDPIAIVTKYARRVAAADDEIFL